MELLAHQVCQTQSNPSAVYVRHRPETTLLYQIVQEYWPEFQSELANHDKYLPALLFLDGVYSGGSNELPMRFRQVKAPNKAELTRPAVSTKRLSLTRNGQIRYELKTPWRNGTTQVIFEPLDFVARLVALVPKPRVNLTRFHGVFA